jgi:hypothetical protein
MGNFLSLRTEIAQTSALQLSHMLHPCFLSPFFTPIALGGVEARPGGDHWYLAGYALEDFVSTFIERGIPQPASIHRSLSIDNDAYLQSITDAVNRQTTLARQQSPFETLHGEATFVADVELDSTILDDADTWFAQHPQAAAYLYGTVDLAHQNRAFRFRFPDDVTFFGAPFLWIRLGLSPFTPNTAEMMIYSQSTIWLHADQGVLADANLDNLADFVVDLVRAQPSTSTTLRLDGSVYFNERPRIERAFARVLQSSEDA